MKNLFQRLYSAYIKCYPNLSRSKAQQNMVMEWNKAKAAHKIDKKRFEEYVSSLKDNLNQKSFQTHFNTILVKKSKET